VARRQHGHWPGEPFRQESANVPDSPGVKPDAKMRRIDSKGNICRTCLPGWAESQWGMALLTYCASSNPF
jgi:hypothetical protein